MSEITKITIKEVIESNRTAITNDWPKIALRRNPELLNEEHEKSEIEIKRMLNIITNEYEELLPFVKRLRNHVSDIVEETHFCAVYLLMCQAMNHWESLFLLAKNGQSSSMKVILRTIKESIALAKLFSFDFRKMKNKHLKKWFAGEIINHGAYRKAMQEFMNEKNENEIIDIAGMANNLYRMESHSTHVAYTSVIECISPFTADFDFEKYTRFKRTSYNLGYVKGSMDATGTAIKFIYTFLLADSDSCRQIEKILVKYDS